MIDYIKGGVFLGLLAANELSVKAQSQEVCCFLYVKTIDFEFYFFLLNYKIFIAEECW